MSTRANIHFMDEFGAAAIIYRHSDGYPSGLGVDLHRFLDEAAKLDDKRFSDPEYLAAKYLVWQANEYVAREEYIGDGKYMAVKNPNPLNFISVSPCLKEHGDIEYRYKVVCANKGDVRPKIYVQRVGRKAWTLIATLAAAKDM